MARRTITSAEGIEEGVRETQIEMMRRDKCDVPFTEAVNWVLLQGLYWNAKSKGMSDEQLGKRLVQWVEGLDKINVNAFLDSIPVTQEDEKAPVARRV